MAWRLRLWRSWKSSSRCSMYLLRSCSICRRTSGLSRNLHRASAQRPVCLRGLSASGQTIPTPMHHCADVYMCNHACILYAYWCMYECSRVLYHACNE